MLKFLSKLLILGGLSAPLLPLLAQPKVISPYMLKQVSATDTQCLKWSDSNDRWEPGDCATGATLSDGDYGDITVSGSGTVMSVDSGAVAFSELSGSATVGQLPSGATLDTEWDTIGEIETATGVNILLNTELATEAALEALLGDVSDVFTNNDGALNDDNLGDNTIGDLSGVTITSWSSGEVLRFNGSALVDAQLAFSDLSGSATDGQIPDTITIDLAATATALAANGANCSAGLFPLGVDASGAVESCTDPLLETELDTIAELQAQIADATLLTTADEGSGNGIDADTVDGVEASEFALLAGRALGQTLIGGTGAGDDLTLQTTSNASKGSYILSELTSCDTIDTDGSGVLACGTDDDVPESGDFGNATDLESTGALSNDVVAADEMADADHGDVSWTSGVASVEAIDGVGVEVTGVSDGQCLVYDGVTDNRWEAGSCGGGGSSINLEEGNVEVISSANLTGLDFLGADFDVTDDSNEGDVAIAAAITRDAEWDTAAEINAATTDDDFVDLTGTQTITGTKTFGTASATFVEVEGATADAFETALAVVDPTADRTITFPNATGTVSLLTNTETLTNKTLTTPTIGDFSNSTHDHTNAAGGGQLDHGGALTGLTDDDHTQYALLAGRSSGQTIIGGTGAGDDLTLQTTSNASKGSYILSELTNCDTIDTDGSGVLSCGTDDGGGSGDAIEVEDGDDGGTFTAIDTTLRLEDQGDINFTFADGGAGGPDTVTATVRANSVALGTDTTGNYAAGDGEAGAALTGDSATAFFSSGTIEYARLPDGLGNPNTDDKVLISNGSAWQAKSVTGCSATNNGNLGYDTSANAWGCTTVTVAGGGTGATSLTDGGVLFGSGTGAVTASAVLTNGQLLIGDGTTDPTLATLSVEAGGEISITNGAGSITLDVVEANLDLAAIGGVLGTGQADADFLLASEQNAGTDVTTDLEEETHADEHTGSGADEIDNRLHARHFAGADCGAKINAALTAGGSTAHVDVDQACGTTISTAVTATAFQLIHFVECGTWTVSAVLTGGNFEGIGNGSPWGPTRGDGCVQLFQANSTNLARMIEINTDAGSVRNIELDGNTTNNTTTDGVFVDGAASVELANMLIKEMPDDGIYVASTTTSNNDAQGVQLRSVRAFDNDGDGLHVEDAQDPFIAMSGFEGNGGHGIFLENSGAMRLEHSDMAGNTGDCLHITGTTGGLDSGLNIIDGNQCGNLTGDGFVIDGHDGSGRVADKNVISNNTFWANSSMTANTYDAIRLEGSEHNVVSGNHIQSHATATFRYGINATDTANSGDDIWALNTFSGTYGTGEINGVSGETGLIANQDNVSTFPAHVAVRTDSIFIECEGAANNCYQLVGSPGTSFLGQTWDLGAVAESGVTNNFLFHTDGDAAARTHLYAGGDLKWNSSEGGTILGTLAHENSADRQYDFPDDDAIVVTDSDQEIFIREEFLGWLSNPGVGQNGWAYGLSGSGSVASTGAENHPGIQQLSTGTTSGSLAGLALAPNISTGDNIDGDDTFDLRWMLRVDSTSNVELFCGLSANNADPFANDQIGFRFDSSSDNGWRYITDSGGTETDTDSTETVVASTWYLLRVRRTSGSNIEFSVDGANVTNQTTNIPGSLMAVGCILENETTTDMNLDLDYMELHLDVDR